MFLAPIRSAKALSPLLALLLVMSVGLIAIAPRAHAGGGKRHFTIKGFALNCRYVKSLADDPVLRHGRPGASPGNDFYAATNADANSTYATLRQSDSTCITRFDTSAYFQPQLLLGGVAQTPTAMYDYYEIPNGADPPSIEQWPNDFSMVADAGHIYWTCGGGGAPHLPARTTAPTTAARATSPPTPTSRPAGTARTRARPRTPCTR